MNLIESIAQRVVKGAKATAIAVELEVEHGVKVSEAWVQKIMGADGFDKALEDARANAERVGEAAGNLASQVESAGAAAVDLVAGEKIKSAPTEATNSPGPSDEAPKTE